MGNGNVLFATIAFGIVLSIFQLGYTVATHQTRKQAAAKSLLDSKVLYRLTETIKTPLARALALRKSKPGKD